jgi:hypothetical protein
MLIDAVLSVHKERRLAETDGITRQILDLESLIIFGKVEQTFQNAFPVEALFKGVSTRFGLQNVEKCFENVF